MARKIALVLAVAFGLVFLSRSCSLTRAVGPIVLTHGRIVGATGADQATRAIVIDQGRIAAVILLNDETPPPSGAKEVDVNGLYIAATTFDRGAPTLIDGIRHVWVGQVGVGDPGDVVIMRGNPGRVRPGYIPDTDSIVAAVIDGAYYSIRDLTRKR
jgi:predicted amidohydrolase